MMTDGEIREALEKGWIKIDPQPSDGDIQPCSIDVHLGNVFGLIPFINRRNFVVLSEKSEVEYRTSNELVIGPNEFVLAQLKERVTLDNQTVARIEGKSSVGRKGISIHATAGFVDAGWDGILTLELHNASGVNVLLRAGDPIGQIAFDRLAVPVQRPYGSKELGSHYQGADRVQGAENLKV